MNSSLNIKMTPLRIDPASSGVAIAATTDYSPQSVKLNLGCGLKTPEQWTNIDYALGARMMKVPLFQTLNKRLRFFQVDWNPRIMIHNLLEPLPFESASVDVAYTSHTLEHFTREDGMRFLRECHRVLRPGGILRVVVPDLKDYVNHYLQGEFPADEFVEKLLVLVEHPAGAGPLKRLMSSLFSFPHKCMYDSESLVARLEKLGFKTKAKGPFESDIHDIGRVEQEEQTQQAVIVEGIKCERSTAL